VKYCVQPKLIGGELEFLKYFHWRNAVATHCSIWELVWILHAFKSNCYGCYKYSSAVVFFIFAVKPYCKHEIRKCKIWCLFCQHIEVKIITGGNHTQLTVRFLKVGDGINDAPSLALADVGIAIQNEAQENAASDVASIVLLGNRLSQVRFAFLIKFLKLISFCWWMMNPEISFPCIMIHITHRHYLSLRVSRRYQLHHPIFFFSYKRGNGCCWATKLLGTSSFNPLSMALNFENVVVLVQQLNMRFVFLEIEKRRRNEIVFFRHEISTHWWYYWDFQLITNSE